MKSETKKMYNGNVRPFSAKAYTARIIIKDLTSVTLSHSYPTFRRSYFLYSCQLVYTNAHYLLSFISLFHFLSHLFPPSQSLSLSLSRSRNSLVLLAGLPCGKSNVYTTLCGRDLTDKIASNFRKK
jgi:hypothetical protein